MILEKLFIPAGEDAVTEERSFLTATFESVLLPSICLGLSLWLRSHDPFFLATQFPWLWIAPLLVALRYGSLGAVLASLTLVSGWNLTSSAIALTPSEFPKEYFLGGFMLTFICGEFRDLWQSENRRQRMARQHIAAHLDALAGSHQFLSLSHDKLTSDFIGLAPTLRDALAALPRPAKKGMDFASSQALLSFLARYYNVEIAAIHLMEGNGLKSTPFASLGQARNLDGHEELIGESIRGRHLCHLSASMGEVVLGSAPYLFAAPIALPDGPVIAVLTVERMAFFAFQAENLRHIAALLGYYGDNLMVNHQTAAIRNEIPDCPIEFADEIRRLHRIQNETSLTSVLAIRVTQKPEQKSNIDVALQPIIRTRSIDTVWNFALSDGRMASMALMPFCNKENGYQALKRMHSINGDDWVFTLDWKNVIDGLKNILEIIQETPMAVDVSQEMGQ